MSAAAPLEPTGLRPDPMIRIPTTGTHVAWTPSREPAVELDADWVVVGSGAGGAAVAVTLARGGDRVCVVEAGAWRDPLDYPSSAYGAIRDVLDGWNTTIARGPNGSLWPVVQASVVGGTTVVNSAIVVRTPGDVFQDWHETLGLGDGSLAERAWQLQDRIEDELHVVPVPARAMGRSNELAVLADERTGGGGHVIDRNVRDCQGSGQCLQGCRGGKKQSTNLNWIPEVLRRGGSVLSCAPVHRVRLQGNRAVGVEGRFRHPQHRGKGARFRVHARRGVVVAASVTHSPLVLHRSGIRPKALGEGFRAHPGCGVLGVHEQAVHHNVGATQGWASTQYRLSHRLKLETLAIPPELLSSRLSGGGRTLMRRIADLPNMTMWVQAVRAESVGRVRPGIHGRPDVKYGLGKRDMMRLREGLGILARMHFSVGAKAILPGVYGLPYSLGPDDLHLLDEAPLDPRCYVAISSHLFGGCVMGADPSTSVCDAEGKVHGMEGLYIGDASAIPTTLGVNPQHTLMSVGMAHAERWLETAWRPYASRVRATA